jgi:hypothetical protein
MRASADRALALNAVYCDRLDEMDLPLLKKRYHTKLLEMIRVFYSETVEKPVLKVRFCHTDLGMIFLFQILTTIHADFLI